MCSLVMWGREAGRARPRVVRLQPMNPACLCLRVDGEGRQVVNESDTSACKLLSTHHPSYRHTHAHSHTHVQTPHSDCLCQTSTSAPAETTTAQMAPSAQTQTAASHATACMALSKATHAMVGAHAQTQTPPHTCMHAHTRNIVASNMSPPHDSLRHLRCPCTVAPPSSSMSVSLTSLSFSLSGSWTSTFPKYKVGHPCSAHNSD